MQIILKGLASGKKRIISWKKEDEYPSLLHLLQANDIPIASSCNGVGQCEKCVTSSGLLSCKILLSELESNEEIAFDYL